MRTGAALLLCLVAVGSGYANSLSSDFVYDDRYAIVENQHIRSLANLSKFFSGTYWAGSESPAGATYRPLALVTLALDHAGWGLEPFGYRLTNLLLHLLAVGLALLVTRRLTGSLAAALLAALLFGLHPIHTEVVNCACNRGDLLAVNFVLGGLWLHTRVLDGPAGATQAPRLGLPALVGAWICFGLACLSKETGVTVLAALLGYDCLYRCQGRLRALGKLVGSGLWVAYLGYAILLLGYLLLRVQAVGSPFERPIGFVENPLAYQSALQQRILAVAIIGWQGWRLLWPVQLSVDYSYHALPLELGWTSPGFLLGLVALAACLGLLAWGWRRERSVALAVIFLASSYSVTSNLLVPNDVMMADRFLALPAFGFALAAGGLLRRAGRGGSVWRQRLVVGLGLLIVSGYFARTSVRNLDWRDNLQLMEATVRSVPGSAKAHAALGQQYRRAGRLEPAAEAYQRALAIWPGYASVQSDLALVWSDLGRTDRAIEAARRATQQVPGDPLSWNNLGFVYYHAGRLREAADAWETALRIRPDFGIARENLRQVREELSRDRARD